MLIVLVHMGGSLKLKDDGYGKFHSFHPELDGAGLPKYEFVVLYASAIRAMNNGLLNPRRYGFVQEQELAVGHV